LNDGQPNCIAKVILVALFGQHLQPVMDFVRHSGRYLFPNLLHSSILEWLRDFM
jgi:hypothetical protein